MTNLDKQQKQSLRNASSKEVEKMFLKVKAHFAHHRWLSAGNEYSADCIKKLREHTQPGANVNGSDLSEYISASAPLHCVDGWITLGRALDSVARDDPSSAIHMSYYAELRAAMSILASEGIGIFSDRHFVVTQSGVQPIGRTGPRGGSNPPLKTHDVVWRALAYWSGLARSAQFFRVIIRPNGIPLGEWLDAFGAGSLSQPVGMKWMKTWGVDLKRLSSGSDQKARNQASYRPTYFNHGARLGTLDCSSFVRRLWITFEPTQLSRFDALDRHLLRLTLRQAFNALPRTRTYEERITAMVDSLLPSGPFANALTKFLTEINESNQPAIIVEASKRSAKNDPRHHLQVLSRAALLLRVATGACTKLLRSGPVSRDDLEFWWKPLGEQHGLWEPGEEPADLTELWADVNASIEDLQDWEDRNTRTNPSPIMWRTELPRQISILGECERVALWGMGL